MTNDQLRQYAKEFEEAQIEQNADVIDDLRGLGQWLAVNESISEAERSDWLRRLESAADHLRDMETNDE